MFATARSATCKTSTRFIPRVYHKSASPLRTAHLPNEAAKAHEKFFNFFLFIRCSPPIQDGPGGVYKSGWPSKGSNGVRRTKKSAGTNDGRLEALDDAMTYLLFPPGIDSSIMRSHSGSMSVVAASSASATPAAPVRIPGSATQRFSSGRSGSEIN